MNKQEFISALRKRLELIAGCDVDERISFYSEIIDDKIEEGMSEEEAVAQIGTVDEVVEQIACDAAPTKPASDTPKRKRGALEITLLVIGSPVWGALLISLFAVVFALWVTLWAVAVTLWAVVLSLCVSSIAVIIAGVALLALGEKGTGVLAISAALICAGLAVFTCYGSLMASKGMVALTKLLGRTTKRCLKRRRS